MTVLAAEAGAGAVEGEAAAGASASRAATRSPRRASRSRAAPAARPDPPSRPERSGGRTGAPVAMTGPERHEFGLEGAWPSANYQGVILGEFVLAVLLVAATPFAQKNKTGVSPYAGKDMLQLAALTVVYFLLAVLAGSSHGAARFAAWFGGLILLAVGLAEAAAIASAVSKYLNPGTSSSSGTGVAEGSAGPLLNPSVVNPAGVAEGSAGSILNPPAGVARAVAQQPGTGLA